jgi:hypothetical protein
VARLCNYTVILSLRVSATDSEEFLSRAVDVSERALRAAENHHPLRVNILNSLSDNLRQRSGLSVSVETMNDLNRVIELLHEAFNTESPHRENFQHNLSNALLRRYERMYVEYGLLDEAMEASMERCTNTVEADDKSLFQQSCSYPEREI